MADPVLPAAEEQPPVNKNKKYRKPKPWDHDGIDHWKIDPLTEEDVGGRTLVDETSFSTLFPKYRETYLREWWPRVTSALKTHHLACQLDLIEGSMTVRTTRKTWDPYIILKARDLIKLLARSVPFAQAVRILEDDMACDVVKIGNIVRNKDRFIKRRQRLIGANGATLKAIELLTGCYILVQGNTVSCMGPFVGLKQVRRVILDCMNNVHPIYSIKELMIKRELAKNPELATESWDRFLPKFRKKSVKKKKPTTIKTKSDTLFPPAPTPRKVDLQIESGEYFLKEDERQAEKRKRKMEQASDNTVQKKRKREQSFQPPKEKAQKMPAPDLASFDLPQLKEKLKQTAPTHRKEADISEYLTQPAVSKRASEDEGGHKKHKKKKSKHSDA